MFGHNGATWYLLHEATALQEAHDSSFIQLFCSTRISHLRASRERDHWLTGRFRHTHGFFWLLTVESKSNPSQTGYPTNFSRVTAHLLIFKCRTVIDLLYAFGIVSFCTRLLFKTCLSLQGTDQLETKAPKILSSQFA